MAVARRSPRHVEHIGDRDEWMLWWQIWQREWPSAQIINGFRWSEKFSQQIEHRIRSNSATSQEKTKLHLEERVMKYPKHNAARSLSSRSINRHHQWWRMRRVKVNLEARTTITAKIWNETNISRHFTDSKRSSILVSFFFCLLLFFFLSTGSLWHRWWAIRVDQHRTRPFTVQACQTANELRENSLLHDAKIKLDDDQETFSVHRFILASIRNLSFSVDLHDTVDCLWPSQPVVRSFVWLWPACKTPSIVSPNSIRMRNSFVLSRFIWCENEKQIVLRYRYLSVLLSKSTVVQKIDSPLSFLWFFSRKLLTDDNPSLLFNDSLFIFNCKSMTTGLHQYISMYRLRRIDRSSSQSVDIFVLMASQQRRISGTHFMTFEWRERRIVSNVPRRMFVWQRRWLTSDSRQEQENWRDGFLSIDRVNMK